MKGDPEKSLSISDSKIDVSLGAFKRQVPRYLLAGGSAFSTDSALYFLFIGQGITYAPAKGASFLLGTIVAYLLNKYFTWEKKTKSAVETVQFFMLYGTTLFLNVSVNSIVLKMLSEKATIIAFICATATSTVINFIGQKWWVFRV